eukprot:5135545-Pyramimonas_sp.AAC.1
MKSYTLGDENDAKELSKLLMSFDVSKLDKVGREAALALFMRIIAQAPCTDFKVKDIEFEVELLRAPRATTMHIDVSSRRLSRRLARGETRSCAGSFAVSSGMLCYSTDIGPPSTLPPSPGLGCEAQYRWASLLLVSVSPLPPRHWSLQCPRRARRTAASSPKSSLARRSPWRLLDCW